MSSLNNYIKFALDIKESGVEPAINAQWLNLTW